jgi:hypothetical protein
MLDPLAQKAMAWLDDLLSHAQTENELLEITAAFSNFAGNTISFFKPENWNSSKQRPDSSAV